MNFKADLRQNDYNLMLAKKKVQELQAVSDNLVDHMNNSAKIEALGFEVIAVQLWRRQFEFNDRAYTEYIDGRLDGVSWTLAEDKLWENGAEYKVREGQIRLYDVLEDDYKTALETRRNTLYNEGYTE